MPPKDAFAGDICTAKDQNRDQALAEGAKPMSGAWKALWATVLMFPSAAVAGSCDSVQFSLHPQISELVDCVKELQFSLSISRTMTNALNQHIVLLESQLCLMSFDMKNEAAASQIGIFCPSKPPSKSVPLPREKPR
jgi:hypothetical protein